MVFVSNTTQIPSPLSCFCVSVRSVGPFEPDLFARLDPTATPPAEASGVSGAVPTVRKENGVVFIRDRVGLVRSGRRVIRRKHKVVEAVQKEVSPTALCYETPES